MIVGRRRRMPWLAAAGVLAVAAALATNEARALLTTAEFEIAVVPSLGGDANEDGIIDGARSWERAADDRSVELQMRVSEPRCSPTASYEWRIDGAVVPADRAGECTFTVTVATEGQHEVAVTIREGETVLTRTRHVSAADHVVVSIGDSVASGEGNPDVGAAFLRRARWLFRPCHRSMLSSAAQAALQVERADLTSRISFVPLGCSGATIPRGLLGDYAGIEPERGRLFAPQVQEVNALAEQRQVDAVLVSIGANDIGFSTIVRFCAAVGDCPERRFDPETPLRAARDPDAPSLETHIATALEQLARTHDVLDAELSSRIPRERVLAVEYFDPTLGPDGFCPMLAERLGPGLITREESEWAHREVLGPLNQTLREAAARHGWGYVDGVSEAFRGHGLCAGSGRWVVTPGESFGTQDGLNPIARLAGTLHPNGAGHLATARLIRPNLASTLGATLDDSLAEPLDDDSADGPLGVGWIVLLAAAGVVLVAAAGLGVWLSWRWRQANPG